MPAHEPIRLLSEAQQGGSPAPVGFVRRTVDLPVRTETLHVACDVPDRPIRLADVVPLVHEIDDRLMAIYLRQVVEQGLKVFCRKGCGTCCHRYLIVYSPAEMYYQMERIESLPEDFRRHVQGWLERTAGRARSSGLIDRLRNAGAGDKPLGLIEQWWLSQDDGTCPFLVDEACGIHPHRFIACREHYSHSPPECCANTEINRMATPVTLINSLWQLEGALTGETGGVLSLPLMKLWADVRTSEAQRTWPAVEVIDHLFGIFAEIAAAAQRLRGSATVDRSEGEPSP